MTDAYIGLLIATAVILLGSITVLRVLLFWPAKRTWSGHTISDRMALAQFLGAKYGSVLPESYVKSLHEAHDRAAKPWGTDEAAVLGVPVGWALGLGAVTLFLAVYFQSLILGILITPAMMVGVFLPLMELKQTADERALAIEFSMPWMLDLVVLTLKSGAGLEQALEAYANTCLDPVLPHEIRRVVSELKMGKTRSETFERFMRRCPFPVVEDLTRAIHSLDRLGTPIADALEAINESMRHQALQNAEANATAAADKMVLPLTVTLVAFIVVVLAPFISQLTQMR